MSSQTAEAAEILEQTAEITAAYVSNNHLPREEIAGFIAGIHATLGTLGRQPEAAPTPDEPLVPAVPIRKSVTPDYLICLEDGKSFKSLKRHLLTRYGLTPDAYRRKWGLPADYPMVAANYAAQRSELARSFGLGRKRSPVDDGSTDEA